MFFVRTLAGNHAIYRSIITDDFDETLPLTLAILFTANNNN